jgi:beta-galactosidase/beta-glucuronidase
VPEDVYRLPVGIRKVEWNSNSVTINGRQIYMRGFGRHEDSAVRPVHRSIGEYSLGSIGSVW